MKVPKPEKSDRPVCPEGNHVGICVGLIDLGTHKEEYQGKIKHLRKIRLVFETPNKRAVFSEDKGEQPFLISRDYTLSMNEKATLRIDIESWRGKKLTDKDLEDYDLKKLLNKVCLVNIIHQATKDGSRVYTKLKGLSPLPEEMKKEWVAENPVQYFSLEEPDWNTFQSFPDFLKTKITESAEYKAIKGEGSDEPF
jgi:hypothetical protein